MAGMNLSGCGLYYMTPYPDDFQITVVYPAFDEGKNYLNTTTFEQAYGQFKKGSKNILRVVYNNDTTSAGYTGILDLQFKKLSDMSYCACVTGGGSIGLASPDIQYNYWVLSDIRGNHRENDKLILLFKNF